jgi:hypothetical protein
MLYDIIDREAYRLEKRKIYIAVALTAAEMSEIMDDPEARAAWMVTKSTECR